MDAVPQIPRSTPDYISIIWEWPLPEGGPDAHGGLTLQARILWLYLYRVAGGVDRYVTCRRRNMTRRTPLEYEAVRRALRNLAQQKLIKAPDNDKVLGTVTIFMEDPSKAAPPARLTPGTSSGQGQLEYAEEPESCPEDDEEEAPAVLSMVAFLTPEDPASHSPAPQEGTSEGADISSGGASDHPPCVGSPPPDPTLGASAHPPHASVHPPQIRRTPLNSLSVKEEELRINARARSKTQELRADVRRLTPPSTDARLDAALLRQKLERLELERAAREACRERERPEDLALGGTIAGALARADETTRARVASPPGDRAASADRWRDFILAQVADKDLYPSVAQKVAWAIVDGLFPEAKLQRILRRLETLRAKKELRGTAWGYFAPAIKLEFHRAGLDWEDKP